MNHQEDSSLGGSSNDDGSSVARQDPDSAAVDRRGGVTGEADSRPDAPTRIDLARDFEIGLDLEPATRPGSLGRLSCYEVLNVVGRGGMGIVVRAFDEQLHRNVAIKLMSSQLTGSPRAKQRFVREARSAATINHPNVITIHAVSEKGGTPFLVMEYVEGRTLQHRITSGAPLDAADIVRITIQICEGLAAAHRRGIIHRDIKPSNILLEDGIERVKISDFGLARLALENSDLTSLGDLVGTPAYMSPEQVAGDEVDGRSDLFSVGCVMYAMIAGRSPFRRSGAIATARCVKDDPHRPITDIRPETPDYLVKIIDRLLEKSPDARFQHAEELCDALNRHLPQVSPMRSEDTTVEARGLLAATSRGQRLRWAVAAILILVLGGLGLTYLLPFQEDLAERVSPADRPGVSGVGEDAVGQTGPGRTLTVASSAAADYATLQQAIEAAQPNDTIRVLDDGRYEGPFYIANADQFAGLQLIATAGATLVASSQGAVLTIGGTPRVRVTGFVLEPGPETHGVYLHYDVPGCELFGLTFRQAADAQWASVLIARQCHATAQAPLVIRDCTFQSTGAESIFIGRDDEPDSLEAASVIIEGNTFDGPSNHLSLNLAAENVSVRFNRFLGGSGIRVRLGGTAKSTGIVLHNNTFLRSRPWLQIDRESPVTASTVYNNLILGGPNDHTPVPSPPPSGWAIHHNLAEIGGKYQTNSSRMVTTVPDAGVPARQSGEEDFLRPLGNGAAATAGVGDLATSYVGAIEPANP